MSKSKSVEPDRKIRYDNHNHWVAFDKTEKRSRSRCKLNDCPNLTHAFCTKCKVHLCCSVNRNCFSDFHGADAEMKPEKSANPAKSVKRLKPVKQPIQMKAKTSGSKPVGIALRKSSRGQSNSTLNRSTTTKIANQNTSPSTHTTVRPSKTSARQNGAKEVPKKTNLRIELVLLNHAVRERPEIIISNFGL